jgi:hypothetical protein
MRKIREAVSSFRMSMALRATHDAANTTHFFLSQAQSN